MDTNNQTQNADLATNTTSTNAADDSQKEVYANGLTYDEIINKDILDLMGFTGLTEEKKTELRKKIEEAVEDRVAARIYDSLPKDDAEKYDGLLEADKIEEAVEFLKSKDLNIEKLLIQETILMKLELIEDSNVLKQRMEELAKGKKEE